MTLIRGASRRLITLLLRFRSNVLPLASWRPADRKACICGAAIQDREHILLRCSRTKDERSRVLACPPPSERTSLSSILQGGHFADEERRSMYLERLERFLQKAYDSITETNLNNGTYGERRRFSTDKATMRSSGAPVPTLILPPIAGPSTSRAASITMTPMEPIARNKRAAASIGILPPIARGSSAVTTAPTVGLHRAPGDAASTPSVPCASRPTVECSPSTTSSGAAPVPSTRSQVSQPLVDVDDTSITRHADSPSSSIEYLGSNMAADPIAPPDVLQSLSDLSVSLEWDFAQSVDPAEDATFSFIGTRNRWDCKSRGPVDVRRSRGSGGAECSPHGEMKRPRDQQPLVSRPNVDRNAARILDSMSEPARNESLASMPTDEQTPLDETTDHTEPFDIDLVITNIPRGFSTLDMDGLDNARPGLDNRISLPRPDKGTYGMGLLVPRIDTLILSRALALQDAHPSLRLFTIRSDSWWDTAEDDFSVANIMLSVREGDELLPPSRVEKGSCVEAETEAQTKEK
ncbi:hypothetical protein sr16637 [Sporisorium reilianum SRZ2]|uniref:Uncharacterized protein n=1 Tax=Sporisorium reilianum (strain SRZ2) TaxID=999809 RepID=E6ZVY1_SPORE|nr:hypothetical protein sr16637 [Sporisorium reilianum SRZ2]